MSSSPSEPSFALDEVKALVDNQDSKAITYEASRTTLELGFVIAAVWDTIARLEPGDFKKTMASKKKPGCMLDVYVTTCQKIAIYLKFQIVQNAKSQAKTLLIVSFKRNENVR